MPFLKTKHTKVTAYDDPAQPDKLFAVYEPGQKPVLCVSHKAALNVASLTPYPLQDLTDPRKR